MLALENSKLGEYFYFINTTHKHNIIYRSAQVIISLIIVKNKAINCLKNLQPADCFYKIFSNFNFPQLLIRPDK